MPKSLALKLQHRQMFGGQKRPGCWKPMKYFEKCPENFQISLKSLNKDSMTDGHVYVGFSPDGKYLLSYQCKFNFHLMENQTELCYAYSLHWWLFDLLQPITKVREVQLFANENIHHELHILICQPPDAGYIVVHGVTYSADQHSNGKMTYVSIVPTEESAHSVHLRYELLPPHPPFVTSISLKIPGVVLLNSGDVLFAILLKSTEGGDATVDKSSSQTKPSINCYCELMKKVAGNEGDSICNSQISGSTQDSTASHTYNTQGSAGTDSDDHQELEEVLSDNIFPTSKINRLRKDSTSLCQNSNDINSNIDTLQQQQQEHSHKDIHPVGKANSCGPLSQSPKELTDDEGSDNNNNTNNNNNNNNNNIFNSSSEDDDRSAEDRVSCNKDYISFVLQGYCLSNGHGTPDSLPSSPFDCTTQVLPCHLSSLDGTEVLKHVYEHRCFKNVYKGTAANCDYFIGQAHFDTENFVNEEIQLCSDINRRFVSIRDYDTQIVDVCGHSKEVLVLINALVVLRNLVVVQEGNGKGERRESYKLSLYTLGYIVSWNVYSGCVTVLKRYPVVEGPGTICKTRQFSPSLSQAVQLRKGFFVPTAKNASVQTLSNHTVFSGKSLQYLFNPVLPVAVVM